MFISLFAFFLNYLIGLAQKNPEFLSIKPEFKLIELNLRVSGLHGWCNLLAQRKYHCDQVSVYIDKLLQRQSTTTNQSTQQRVFLFKNNKGEYSDIDMKLIKQLKTYSTHEILNSQMSKEQHQEESLLTVVMLILLESAAPAAITADTERLLKMEQNGDCLK